jgi:hypothetical protein
MLLIFILILGIFPSFVLLANAHIHCNAPIQGFYLLCQLFFHENWILNFVYSKQKLKGKSKNHLTVTVYFNSFAMYMRVHSCTQQPIACWDWYWHAEWIFWSYCNSYHCIPQTCDNDSNITSIFFYMSSSSTLKLASISRFHLKN